tara:strand:- start:887 stop:1438 length:552 start_codon:yes stop_codon:yes gene_type:complete
LSWFDIIKEPLISIPKGSVRIKKPKKIETKKECKERIKAFLGRLRDFCKETSNKDEFQQPIYSEGYAKIYWVEWEIDDMEGAIDTIEEEAACKLLEEIRKAIQSREERWESPEGNIVMLGLDEYQSQPRLALLMKVEHWDYNSHTWPEQGNWVSTSFDITLIFDTMEQRTEYAQKISELMKSV